MNFHIPLIVYIINKRIIIERVMINIKEKALNEI